MATGFTSLADLGKDAPQRRTLRRSGSQSSMGGSEAGSHSGRRSRKSKAGSLTGGLEGLRVNKAFDPKKKVLTLVEKAMTTPGRIRLREVDPRHLLAKEGAGQRKVVVDWRKNRWEGACRLVDRLIPQIGATPLAYTMKLTGLARGSQVPENNGDPSSSECSEESNDEIVNSDEEDLSDMMSSANNSTATGTAAGRSVGGSLSGMSKAEYAVSRHRNKMKQRMTGWLSQYSGCSKGHGERLMRKIYKPRAIDRKVHMNSGVQAILLRVNPPCFCSLQAVSFRNFLIGNRGVQALWPLLKYARALKSLSLAGNDIHDSGMRHVIKVLAADLQSSKKDDVGGLLALDLSYNPVTQRIHEELCGFMETRKDILLVGLAGTLIPMVKRQRSLRKSLARFAAAEAHLSLEAWRLANDPEDFTDRELFVQCERVVEATHGQAIHDMMDLTKTKGNRGWGDDASDEFSNGGGSGGSGGIAEGDEDFEDGDVDFIGAQDGFLGLDDIPSPSGELAGDRDRFGSNGFAMEAEYEPDDPARSLSMIALVPEQLERDTPVSPTPPPPPPPPPPPQNPFALAAENAGGGSWAAQRRRRAGAGLLHGSVWASQGGNVPSSARGSEEPCSPLLASSPRGSLRMSSPLLTLPRPISPRPSTLSGRLSGLSPSRLGRTSPYD